MHVCHFCETSVGGNYFKNISKGLTEKGVRVSCLELGPSDPPKWLSEVPDVKYLSLGITSRRQYPLAVLRLVRLLRREKIDILQTHLYNAGLIGVLAGRFSPRKIVALTRHHTSIVKDLGTRFHVGLDKWMTKRADFAVAVSEAVKRYMVEIDGIREGHVEVVHLGFDFDKLAADRSQGRRVRDEFGFSDDDFIIGYVANFAPRKGHIQLIEALGKIIEKVPEAKLFLIGKGGLPEVDDAIERLDLREKVVFAGWREDVAACLSAMDLFVQPSLSEAFSQVLIEAMGAGLPVIATDVGGAREVIRSGENGFLIEPDDVSQIIDKTLRLWESADLRRRIGSAGRDSVRARFTVERMVDRQYELYRLWMNENNGK
ncbi:MAG: glycosyltransferase family 4 protein [Pyrinomonadaceae bacterium]